MFPTSGGGTPRALRASSGRFWAHSRAPMHVGVGVSLVDDKQRRAMAMVALLGLMASGLLEFFAVLLVSCVLPLAAGTPTCLMSSVVTHAAARGAQHQWSTTHIIPS